ncbi:MAG: hypothetical protein QOC96_84 [Acidobacteriota bacterium]|jgi:hypothetical protein|nr:hypothetical protein [Acidobacteriota bacterium]
MRQILAVALLAGLWLVTANITAQQQSDPQQRAQEIAASFNKSKHQVKEKHGVRIEKFKEVRSEPVVRKDAREYSGTYVADLGAGYTMKVEVGTDGRVQAAGSEPGPNESRKFTLRDAKIQGALLTGTKVYEDGTTEKFEGVFINRTERESQTDSGTTSFGLAVVYDPPKVERDYSFSLTRLFYKLEQ